MQKRFSLIVASILLACGGSGKLAPEAQAPTETDPLTGRAKRPADALCGEGWRWVGGRCMELASEDGEGPTVATPEVEAPDDEREAGGQANPSAPGDPMKVAQIHYEDLKVGEGNPVKRGDIIVVHYDGRLANGTRFDSSRDRGTPFQVKVGDGNVIRGFERGVIGMKRGGVRRVNIPPDLGYGARGAPPAIPPNAELVFDIELIAIKE